MSKFWGWLAMFAAKRLGYKGCIPAYLDDNSRVLLLLPKSLDSNYDKEVHPSQCESGDCCNKGECNEAS